MSKLKLNIRIGRNYRTIDAESPLATRFITDEIIGEIGEAVSERVKINLSTLQKTLRFRIEQAYVSAVHFAAKNMIGRTNRLGQKQIEITDPDGEGITLARWNQLAPRTIHEQRAIRNTKDSGKFFSQTGALKAELLQMARTMVKRTGVVRVLYRNRGKFAKITSQTKSVPLADFTITLMPSINRASLPGLISGRSDDHDTQLTFERKLGLSPQAIRKLKGAGRGDFIIPGTHRPLLQPVFTYWTLNRIPRTIAAAITSSINTGPKIDDSSGNFVGTIMQ